MEMLSKKPLWNDYVLARSGADQSVKDVFIGLFTSSSRILYLTGIGFDPRGPEALREFSNIVSTTLATPPSCDLLSITCEGYNLGDMLQEFTSFNADEIKSLAPWANHHDLSVRTKDEDGKIRTSHETASLLTKLPSNLSDYTDIIVDVSSMPRVVYLTLILHLLGYLVPNKQVPDALGKASSLIVIAAEDPELDSKIVSEEIAGEISTIQGFSGRLGDGLEQQTPTVLFPVLGEGRKAQLNRVFEIAQNAEVCPILPHPSKDPRRGDKILSEYSDFFVDSLGVDKNNLLYADESNPFEAYRQLREAMRRYEESLSLLDGCRLWVAPLSSKLITVGIGLACFECHTTEIESKRSIGLLYAEPQRYSIGHETKLSSNSTFTALVLTGPLYQGI